MTGIRVLTMRLDAGMKCSVPDTATKQNVTACQAVQHITSLINHHPLYSFPSFVLGETLLFLKV